MYYVYEWYFVDTGEVFYVGKGCRNRFKVRHHNSLFDEALKSNKCESRVIQTFQTEQEAFEYECYRVNELKAIGQCKCNIHEGGRGGSTEWWTDELRNHYSVNNVMKSEAQRRRMSEFNPMKNPEIAEHVNSQKKRAVIVGEHEYASIKDAHEQTGASVETITNWCNKGINQNGEKCRYKDSEQIEFVGKRYNKGGSRPVVFEGREFECVKDFAEEIGIGENTAGAWLKRGFNPDGVPCRYANDDRELEFVNRHVARNKAKARPVIVNGIQYCSCEEASQKTGIPKSTLYSYLQNAKRNPNVVCEYGNQQPSQGNVD